MKVQVKFDYCIDDMLPVGAFPIYHSGETEFFKLLGKTKTINITKTRNKKHHDFFFAKLRMVVDNSDKWSSPESLLTTLKWTIGWVEEVIDFNGGRHVTPKSIDFDTINEDEFSGFESQCDPFLASVLKCSIDDLNDPEKWESYL